ncbi:MAG: AraC family transcriptional regulator [bacterium]
MVPTRRVNVLGKIAADLESEIARRDAHGAAGCVGESRIAAGDGWSVTDVICTSGPRDRAIEEQHAGVSIGVVVAGTFQYRSPNGRCLLTPGSLLLGNDGECFECGHEHATGDRCIAFRFAPAYFEQAVADAGVKRGSRRFRVPQVPPVRALSPLATRVAAGALQVLDVSWEETALEIAVVSVQLAASLPPMRSVMSADAGARVTESIRRIEEEPSVAWSLARLSADAGLSAFHYLRTFQETAGVTPHQFILRARLREAALRLLVDDAKIIDVALGAGFGDVSNFNKAFRLEYGVVPRAYREGRRGARPG